jgi:hydrogenase large subunit
MCFKNLPIEFDENGKARVKEGVADAYALDGEQAKSYTKRIQRPVSGGAVATKGKVRDWMIDPITRVAGALAIHVGLDVEKRVAVESHSMAMLFRGYEIILQGRDPRDAIDISSRACGVCGGVHAAVSSQLLDMAFGVKPPPMGVAARNLGAGAEMLYDHPIHLGLLSGPDYSTALVQVTNPEIVKKAATTPAPHANIHGYKTVKDIMDAMNPLTGAIYLEAIEFTRLGREMCNYMFGKYPHPSTLIPGGVMTTLSTTSFNEFYSRLIKFFDYSKRIAGWWDDVLDFFLDCNPDYALVGARPNNLIQTGIWDDPWGYDPVYEKLGEFGNMRWSMPGIIRDGELVTTNLHDINSGLEEFVTHSFYDEWTSGSNAKYATDPIGNPISPYHFWNKTTIPRPEGRNFKEKYSWDVAPRWDRAVMETGVYGRMWTTAAANVMKENDFIQTTGDGLKMLMPKFELPEMELEWKIPTQINAFERNRARAYAVSFTAAITMNMLLQAFELWRKGETKAWTQFKIPKGEIVACGYTEAGRGYLSHHMIMDKGRIVNYQICTPSTWNAAPQDPFGNPGPYEEAVIGTPLLEKTADDELKGIDVLRAIRSFDPCMPCTTHLDTGKGVMVREINSCSCTLE